MKFFTNLEEHVTFEINVAYAHETGINKHKIASNFISLVHEKVLAIIECFLHIFCIKY